MDMSCLYDSDAFVVVHIAAAADEGDGFEIVDKAAETSTYLHGPMAEAMRFQIKAWQTDIPQEEEEVHELLASYSALNRNPLVQH